MTIDAGAMESALLVHLKTLTPAWSTKKIGVPFVPAPNQPWQRGTFMPGKPDTVGFGNGAYSRLYGVYQVDLFYPKQAGETLTLFNRAKAVRDLFFPTHRRGLQLTAGDGAIEIEQLPAISQLIEGDVTFNQIFIEIPFRADDAPSAA